ncbi:MAG: lysophospholipid acyltransferase family protein [Chloroflexota bacterium]
MLRLGCWLTTALPLPLQLLLADAAGELGWRLLPAMHQRVRENAQHVLGQAATRREVEQLARTWWRNYLRYLREFVAIPNLRPADLDALAQNVEGWSCAAEALARGKGAVIVSAHFGNWDLAAAVGARVCTVHALADRFGSPRLDRLVNSFRSSLGVQVIPIERPLKRTLRALKRGEAVAFLVDKPVARDGVVVQFFGSPVQIPGGAGFFALRTGAPILPAFVWRERGGVFRGKVLPAILPTHTGQPERDLQRAMQQVMAAIEDMVRAQPEHWYMFRRMWQPRATAA